jgi:hypothetical protein
MKLADVSEAIALMMDAACTAKTSVSFYQTTRRAIFRKTAFFNRVTLAKM